MENKINLAINDGNSFYAHQASVNFNPMMIFFDFKNITPRVDERNKEGATLVMKHDVVMLDPYHALLFKDLLNKVIVDYEKEFGKIEKPKAIQKLEKKKGKPVKKLGGKNQTPTYFG